MQTPPFNVRRLVKLARTYLAAICLVLVGCGGGSGNGAGGNGGGPSSFSVSGTVSGLSGNLVLQDNGADDLGTAANSTFTFATKIATGAAFNVTVKTQPSGQTCSISNGAGTMGNTAVTNVAVQCVNNIFSVGGSLSGLTASGLVLANGNDAISPAANATAFIFPTKQLPGSTYAVTVQTQPIGQSCTVAKGSGSISNSDVSDVSVMCRPTRFLVKDVMSTQGDTTGKLYHTIFHYDGNLQITAVDQALSLDANHPENYGVTRTYSFVYDAIGHLISYKPSDGPGFNCVYLSQYSLQIAPVNFDPAHDSTATFNFNDHDRNELDDFVVFVPPASTNGSNYSRTDSFLYNPIGGIQSETSTNLGGGIEDQWALFSAGSASPVPNPFSNGTTIEQRFIYYTFKVVGAWDMLGGAWSNGVYENYSYSTGSKVAKAHFTNNDYTLDANGNVSRFVPSYAIDAPAFNTWIQSIPIMLTYEQH